MQQPTDAGATVVQQVDKAQSWISRIVDYSAQLLAQYGFRFLGAIVVLTIAYFVAGWTKRAVHAALVRTHVEPTIAKFTSNASRYAVLILALMSCAPIMGINVTAFAALIGASGLAVGLASQGALSNGAA